MRCPLAARAVLLVYKVKGKGRLPEEEVLHEMDRQYQLATGGRCLLPMIESMKGWMCQRARARGNPAAGWMG